MIILINQKRKEEKRKKLIKQLFNKMKRDFCPDSPIKIRIAKRGYGARARYYYKENKAIITLTDYSFCFSPKRGFTDYYYKGRSKQVNSIVKNNRHNYYRFVLLHELKHCLDYLKFKGNYHSNFDLLNRELRADKFAIENLKRY